MARSSLIRTIADVPGDDLLTGGHTACGGCGASLGLKLALKALGRNTIVINASGCMTLLATYPCTPLRVPWLHLAIENAAAAASGLRAALDAQKKDATILCYAGDGATYDIGLQALSGACERQDRFVYVCYNNQSYGNTGVQKASSTPQGAYTTTTPVGRNSPLGKDVAPKPLPKIIASHGIPYVATACVSFPIDYMQKLQRAQRAAGPAFIDLLTPCPVGWGFEPSLTVEMGRRAVSSGAWPLYEIADGAFKLTHSPSELQGLGGYLMEQKRFQHLSKSGIAAMQKDINKAWAKYKKGEF